VKRLEDIYKLDLSFYLPIYMKDCKILYQKTSLGKKSIIYDLKDDSYIMTNVGYKVVGCETFKFDNVNYYLLTECGCKKDMFGKLFSVLFVHIYANIVDFTRIYHYNEPAPIDYNNVNYNEKIVFMNDDEKVEIPFYLVQRRCELIKSMFDDIYSSSENRENIFPVKLKLNNCRNFELYKKFIRSEIYDEDRVYDLFKLCDYLQDISTEYLASVIVMYVNNNNMKICKAFKYLQLLYSSTCHRQFDMLICIIYNKYERRHFLERIQDKSLRMNVYVQKYLEKNMELD